MNSLIVCMALLAIIVWGAVLSQPAPPPIEVRQHIVIEAARPVLVRPSPTPGCRYAASGACSGGGWGDE